VDLYDNGKKLCRLVAGGGFDDHLYILEHG